MDVVIVDYGMGNLYSIESAFKYLGIRSCLSSDRKKILTADRIILPGVGAYHEAMMNLNSNCMVEILKHAVLDKKIPILGICLGMQLMGSSSAEGGFTEGLNFVNYTVDKFHSNSNLLKVPHVGFNTSDIVNKNNILFSGLPTQVDFYYTHSYRMVFDKQENQHVTSICDHGGPFVASIEKDNICGTQFHPEKSQSNGLVVLKNFLEWRKSG